MKVFASNTYAAGPLWLEGAVVIWVFALPVAACAWQLGNLAALILTVLAVLPRLLWRPNSPPEGRAFIVANALYWNMVSPLFFGSPLFVALFVSVWPRACGGGALLYVVTVKLLVRPDLADSSAWPFFSQRDWGIRAMRQYLRLRVHVSDKLIARPVAQPVIIAIHPHGIAADFRVALDGLLYAALPGRTVLALAASVLFSLPFVRELCLWTRCIDASKKVAAQPYPFPFP